MAKGEYPHPRHVRAGDECIRCGMAVARELFACSIVRYYNKPDGRHAGRSLGAVRICRTCAAELIASPARRGRLDPTVVADARASSH